MNMREAEFRLRARETISNSDIPDLARSLMKKLEAEPNKIAIESTGIILAISEYLRSGEVTPLIAFADKNTDQEVELKDGLLTGRRAIVWLMEQGGIEPPTELS